MPNFLTSNPFISDKKNQKKRAEGKVNFNDVKKLNNTKIDQ
jgi:hypothetical protein